MNGVGGGDGGGGDGSRGREVSVRVILLTGTFGSCVVVHVGRHASRVFAPPSVSATAGCVDTTLDPITVLVAH